MKKYFTLAFCALSVALCANAAQLSPEQAINRVRSSRPAKIAAKFADTVEPVLAVKAPGNAAFTALYVFNDASSGYMIVSADDVAVPLLGYSDSGSFDSRNIPSGLRYWLDFYASEIAFAAKNPSKAANAESSVADRAPVAPLLTTKWNQDAPYNDDCPMYGGQRSVTGCVATAMAQAMKFHNWPEKGKGSNSYTNNGQTISLDFANITFDWANMTDTYGASSTAAQNKAVAQLMYACGVSVDMDYTSDESGASSMDIAPALYKYFDYSGAMTMPQRAFYGLADWQNLVYDQLAAGLPVLYGGQSNQGGHQFVCDGYSSDGYFHFNWGWAGESDGYYLLSALDPMTQGIGGSTTGFNYDQSIVANMQPSNAATFAAVPLIYCYGDFGVETSSTQTGGQAEFTSGQAFYNFGCKEADGAFGIKITDGNGNATYASAAQTSLPAVEGVSAFEVTIPSDLADGSYTVTPAFKSDGKWVDILAPLSGTRSLSMSVAYGDVTFTANKGADLNFTDFSLNSDIYLGTNFKADFTIENTGADEYYGQLMMALLDEGGNLVDESQSAIAVDIDASASADFSFIGTFPTEMTTESGSTETVSPGTYTLAVFDYLTGSVVYEYPQAVNVREAPSNTSLRVGQFALANAANNVVTDVENIQFSGRVECVEGYYADQLKVAIFPEGATSTSIEGSTDYLFIDAGQSADFTATVDLSGAESGAEYFAIVYDANNNQLSNALSFTIGSTHDGIDSITSDSLSPATFYNMQGVEIDAANLTPGIYIMRQGTEITKVRI